MKRFLVFLFFPLVAFGEYDDTHLKSIIVSQTDVIKDIRDFLNDPSGTLQWLGEKLSSIQTASGLIKSYVYDLQQGMSIGWGLNIAEIKKDVFNFVSWWDENLKNPVLRTTNQFYWFLNAEEDPYELNEYHVWRLNSDPGDMSPLREFEPYVRPHNFSTTFKDYFEDYSNNHLEILTYNNKLLADIAMSLAPTGKQYTVNLPSVNALSLWGVDPTHDTSEFWLYVNSGNTLPMSRIFYQWGQAELVDESFADPNEAIIHLLENTYDMQMSYSLPMMIMITNQQAIISRLTHADTSFTNELATTVSEDTADPGKYDTELDGVISSLDIEQSSFFSGFKESFSAPSSASLSFQMPQSVPIYLGEFLDFHFPVIDIDTSGYSRFFAILRKCMIAFWGVVSFAFWASVFKLFVFISAKFALFFGPQVSDGLGKS